MTVVGAVLAAVAGIAGTLVVLSVWAHVRYARRLAMFRCRIGPPTARGHRAPWRWGRQRAGWVGNVLLQPAGPLHLFLTPLAVEIPRTATVRPVPSGRTRGLGPHPVTVRLTALDGGVLELTVAQADADDVVGPFLAAALPELPPAPRDPNG